MADDLADGAADEVGGDGVALISGIAVVKETSGKDEAGDEEAG